MTTPSASELYVVDSAGWVEFIADGPRAPAFARYLEREASLVMPAIVMYEVYKKLRREAPKILSERFVSHALRARVIPLDGKLALQAAVTSMESKLPMADAIIYAMAQAVPAQLITSDSHFQGLPGVILV